MRIYFLKKFNFDGDDEQFACVSQIFHKYIEVCYVTICRPDSILEMTMLPQAGLDVSLLEIPFGPRNQEILWHLLRHRRPRRR